MGSLIVADTVGLESAFSQSGDLWVLPWFALIDWDDGSFNTWMMTIVGYFVELA